MAFNFESNDARWDFFNDETAIGFLKNSTDVSVDGKTKNGMNCKK